MRKVICLLLMFSVRAYALTNTYIENGVEYGLSDNSYTISDYNSNVPQDCQLVSCEAAPDIVSKLGIRTDYVFCDTGLYSPLTGTMCTIYSGYAECSGTPIPLDTKAPLLLQCSIEESSETAEADSTYTYPEDGENYCYKDMNGNDIYDDPDEMQKCISTDNGSLCPIDKTECNPVCPAGSTYDSQLQKCVVPPVTGYCQRYCARRIIFGICIDYDYRCSINGVSYGTADACSSNCYSCPSGFIYQDGRCIASSSFSCPLGDYPCWPVDGKYYCSDVACFQYSSSAAVSEDTPEGINDKQDDGTVDSSGICTGFVYIFNGKDYRCRPPGTQTGFSNCCLDSDMWFGVLPCKDTEKTLAVLKHDGKCHYVGEYCASKLEAFGHFIACLQEKRTYCCFTSKLARIVQEQGRPQIGLSWGTPESPVCRGFTVDEFQKLDFGKMDLSELYEDMQEKVKEGFKAFYNATLTK
ncbi:conjugal transfer protein TraN [Desulfurobacterium sp. TC5-1]|uniref:conjugal transfer protein TraN n=1 Tax=Desulfurobacterium sp. TC5-1 TaxID=1158318 RepID=UPI0003B6232F|nr:conjugal transfer protein TraN [Desulfurobacterium sp. TC5-1]